MNFVSIGGLCNPNLALRGSGLRHCSLPFDWVRSKFEGVIECIESDFSNYYPKKIIPTKWIKENKVFFRGKHFTFFHHDITDKTVISKLNHRIGRFKKVIYGNDIIFMRTMLYTSEYDKELKHVEDFHAVMKSRFPGTSYKLVFTIENQEQSRFFRRYDERTFCFTANCPVRTDPRTSLDEYYAKVYEPILSTIINTEYLTKTIPKDQNINIIHDNRHLCDWMVNGHIPVFSK